MVDDKNKIVLKEVNICDFVVKLKISHYLQSQDTFRDEARRHFENLKSFSDSDIDLSQLLDSDNRVTFVRGIAGMGKTVLAKQLACGWANGSMYNSFKICIMFECRDINYFVANQGAHLKRHEQLREFLRAKFNYYLETGEAAMFVVDGLDELNDINTGDSLIAQLLNHNGCGTSKFILTGRPHIEYKLEGYGELGGLRRVEIQGISDEQIQEYARRFPSPKGFKVDLNMAKDSSEGFFPIMHIPQFLNTFCCIVLLLKGEAIHSAAELYSWTIYLLLRQHAEKHGSREMQISKIFNDYSNALLSLGKVSHMLLNENKIVILQTDIETLLCGSGKQKEFIESFFVDASDNFETKYQFQHLTLMEFLSAFHICSSKARMDY